VSASCKVFCYLTRPSEYGRELLVFDSHDEPGLEVPKGSVEAGESAEAAVSRELLEEAGVAGIRIVRRLGTTTWRDEQQVFFLAESLESVATEFEHIVTGDGADTGLHYRFRWRRIDRALGFQLVQGCGRFFDRLLGDAEPWSRQ